MGNMEDKGRTTRTLVEMTPDRKAAFEAWEKEQEKRRLADERARQREELQGLADEAVEEVMGEMLRLNGQLAEAKRKAWDTFGTLIEMRKEVNGRDRLDREQYNFTFTTRDGRKRIRMGYNMLDGWDDAANDGIAMVKDYLASLAKDEKSAELVALVLKLLAKDSKGNLKASRVIQLRAVAEKSGDEGFIEGMRIIGEAYRPTRSRTYIRCDVKRKDADGSCGWQEVALGINEA